jgi:hypothetical protein
VTHRKSMELMEYNQQSLDDYTEIE